MKVSIFLTSFFSMYSSGLKSGTSPAILTGKVEASNLVIYRMPDLPSVIPFQFFSIPVPRGLIIPTPVTTIRRFILPFLKKLETRLVSYEPLVSRRFFKKLFCCFFIYIIYSILDGLYLFSIFIRYFYVEFFFKCHNHLYRIKGVCSQVVNKRCLRLYLLLGYTQLINDNFFNLTFYNHCDTSLLLFIEFRLLVFAYIILPNALSKDKDRDSCPLSVTV